MIKINLIPYRSDRRKDVIIQQSVIAAIPLIIVLAVIAVMHFTISSKIDTASTQIVKLENAIKESKVAIKEINTFKKKKETLLQKMEVITNLQKGKQGPVHIIDELAVRIPGNLWLTEIKQKGMSLEIIGKAMDNISISNYMVGLEESPYISNVDLGKIISKSQSKAKGIHLKDFVITCDIKYEAETTNDAT